MEILFLILLSNFLISIISLIGIFTFFLNDKILKKLSLFFVALSAGALMGGAFLHLIPESLEILDVEKVFLFLLLGFSLFFFVEKILHWRHCHEDKCPVHTFAHMNILGEGIHNFLDGFLIAASFIVDINLGIVTSIAVAFHEIPQEIGDIGVLIHAGYTKKKALFFNFLIALTAILGGILGYYLNSFFNLSESFLLPITAGGFIYVAASDLVPEIRKDKSIKNSLISLGVFIFGILLMYLMKNLSI